MLQRETLLNEQFKVNEKEKTALKEKLEFQEQALQKQIDAKIIFWTKICWKKKQKKNVTEKFFVLKKWKYQN